MNKETKERSDTNSLPPKPPELLQKLKWMWIYGRKHWKIVTIGVVIIVLGWFVQFHTVKESMNLFLEEDKQPVSTESTQPPNTPGQLLALG